MPVSISEVVRRVVGDAVPESIIRSDGQWGPAVPLGRRIALPGRGTTFVREIPGPAGAPTIVLLHGYMASGGLNWFRTFEPLSREFNIVAPDLRGHARGIRSRRRMRLSDCADDIAALIEHLGTGPVIAAGYSMGGPVAQLLWRRHPEHVAGLVLCATASQFDVGSNRLTDAYLAGLAGLARVTDRVAAAPAAGARVLRLAHANRPAGFLEWAAQEMRRHDVRMLADAARSIGRFDSRSWLGEVDVPTAVLRTNRDRLVDPQAQTDLANGIRLATIVDHDHGHIACSRSDFADPMLAAARDVAWRTGGRAGTRQLRVPAIRS